MTPHSIAEDAISLFLEYLELLDHYLDPMLVDEAKAKAMIDIDDGTRGMRILEEGES